MKTLTEEDFADIELAASKAMREWERGYYPQDINVRHHISWWVMQETAKWVSENRPIVAEQQGGDPIWKTMDSAPKEPGMEIIAARFGIYAELTAMCEKSPFISFFMHSRGKFYGDPTHWLCKVPASFPPVRP